MAKAKCNKKGFKDKASALYALHKIQNMDDGRKKPIRAYECPTCLRWHLTSKSVDQDKTTFYKLKLDWSRFINK